MVQGMMKLMPEVQGIPLVPSFARRAESNSVLAKIKKTEICPGLTPNY